MNDRFQVMRVLSSIGYCCGGAVLLSLGWGCTSDGGSARDAADAGGRTPEGGTRTERVYVTMNGDDEVTVLDPVTRNVTGHIPVGKFPAILLATPDGSKLYTANWGDDSISAIDAATEQVTAIPLDSKPWVEAMSPDGQFLYVGLGSGEIGVVSTENDTIVRTLPSASLPASIIVSPDSETLYVAHIGNSELEAVSARTGDVVHPGVTVGGAPAWITITPDGSVVYSLNFLSGDVSVLDAASFQITATVSTGAGSAGIIGNVTPDGALLCVTDYGTLDVTAIDTHTNEIAWTLPTQGRPVGVGFSPDGARGYVGDYGPKSLDVTPADLAAALVNGTPPPVTDAGTLLVFDPHTGKTLGERIPVGRGPSSVVVVP
jgi:YVTN family beta-propeller protein